MLTVISIKGAIFQFILHRQVIFFTTFIKRKLMHSIHKLGLQFFLILIISQYVHYSIIILLQATSLYLIFAAVAFSFIVFYSITLTFSTNLFTSRGLNHFYKANEKIQTKLYYGPHNLRS